MEPISPSSIHPTNPLGHRRPDLHVSEEKSKQLTQEVEKQAITRSQEECVIYTSGFAHVFGDSLIPGGLVLRDFTLWTSWLDRCKSRDNTPFLDPSLSHSEIDIFEQDLQDITMSGSLLFKGEIENLMKCIQQGVQARGRFALYLSICREGTGKMDHDFVAIFTKKEENTVICELLNKGEGSSRHPLVSIDGKEKRSFFSYPIHFEDFSALMNTDKHSVSYRFFATLAQYARPSPPDQPYRVGEVYDWFALVGKQQTDGSIESSLTDEDAASSQRSKGFTPFRIPQLALRHQLLRTNGVDKKSGYQKYKKAVFSHKADILLSTLVTLRQDPQSLTPDLVQEGVRAFRVSLLKMQKNDVLADEEGDKCKALCTLIDQELTTIHKNTPKEGLPNFAEDIPEGTPPAVERGECPLPSTGEKTPIFPKAALKDWGKVADPKELASEMQSLLAIPASFDRHAALYRCIRNLPLPNDPFWENIPVEDVDSVLASLNTVQMEYVTDVGLYFDKDIRAAGTFPFVLLHTLTCYGIFCRLSTRSPTLKMENFRPRFLPDFDFSPYLYFHHFADQKRWEDLLQHLRKWESASFGKKCLGLWNVGELHGHDSGLLNTAYPNYKRRGAGPEQQHLQYAAQFIRNEITLKKLTNVISNGLPQQYRSFQRMYYYTVLLVSKQKELDHWFIDNASTAFQASAFYMEGKADYHYPSHYQSKDLHVAKFEQEEKAKPFFRNGAIANPLLASIMEKGALGQENRILLKEYDGFEKPFPDGIYHEFEKIVLEKDLRIASALRWCEEYALQLDFRDLRHAVEFLFLRDTQLASAICQEPLLIPRLHAFFAKMIEGTLRNKRPEEVLFWIRLAVHVETAVREVDETGHTDRVQQWVGQLEGLRQAVEGIKREGSSHPLWDREIFFHKAYIGSLFPLKEKEAFSGFIQDWFFANYSEERQEPDTPSWLYAEVVQNLKKEGYFSSRQEDIQGGTTSFLVSVSEEEIALIFDASSFPLVSATLQGTKDLYTFDLRTGKVRCNNLPFACEIFPWKDVLPYEKEVLLPFAKTIKKVAPGKFAAAKKSCIVKMASDKSNLSIEKTLTFNGKEGRYTYTRKGKFEHPITHNAFLWQSTADAQGNWTIMILERDGVPRAQAFFTYRTLNKIVKVDEQGAPVQPEEHVLFPDKMCEDSIRNYLEKFQSEQEMIFWKREGRLHRVEFPCLHLSFTMRKEKGQVRAFCDQMKKYHLMVGSDLGLVYDLPGALLLEKQSPTAPRYVLLPFHRIAWEEDRYFGGKPAISHRGRLHAKRDEGSEYFLYEVDEKQEQLVHPLRKAMLYLVYVLLEQGDYEQAEKYIGLLDSFSPFSEEESKVFNCIFSIGDAHPAIIALKMHVALLFIDGKNRALLERLQTEGDPQSQNTTTKELFCESIYNDFCKYLDLAQKRLYEGTTAQTSQIPDSLLLTKEQMGKIISFITKNKERKEDQLFYNFNREEERKNYQYPFLYAKDFQEKLKICAIRSSRAEGIPDFVQDQLGRSFFLLPTLHFRQRPEENTTIAIREKRDCLDSKEGGGRAAFLSLLKRALTEESGDSLPAQIDVDLQALYGQKGVHNEKFMTALWMARKQRNNLQHLKQEIEKFFTHYQTYKKNKTQPFHKSYKEFENRAKSIEKTIQSTIGEQFGSLQQSPPIEKKYPISQQQTIEQETPPIWPFVRGKNEKSDVQLSAYASILHSYLDVETKSPQEEEFVLHNAIQKETDPVFQVLGRKLLEGHEENQQAEWKQYTWKDSSSVAKFCEAVQSTMDEAKEEAGEAKRRVEAHLNPPDKQLLLDAKQRPRRTVCDAILDPSLVSSEVWQDVLLYQQKMVVVDQGKKILHSAQKWEKAEEKGKNTTPILQELGSILDTERRYDPEWDPEILAYEFFSGNQLRNEPDQAAILRRIFAICFSGNEIGKDEEQEEIRKLFFEFQAGGGKTKVLSVILVLRALREGKHPVFFSLSDLFDVAKDDLNDSLRRFFRVKVHPIRVELSQKVDVGFLQKLYEDIVDSHKNKWCDLFTAETWHFLYLSYQEASIVGDRSKKKVLGKILSHYRKHGFFLVDEPHINLDPLLRANVAFGDPKKLAKNVFSFSVVLLQVLAGWKGKEREVDGELLASYVQIRENLQAVVSKSNAVSIRQGIVDYFLENEAFSCTEEQQTAIENYLSKKEEGFLAVDIQDPELLQKIFLTKGMVWFILPTALELAHRMDYGPGRKEKDFTEAPWQFGAPMEAKFEKIHLQAALTIQGTIQRGVHTTVAMREFLQKFTTEFEEKKNKYPSIEQNPLFVQFLSWQENIPEDDKVRLDEVTAKDLENEEKVLWFCDAIGKQDEVVDRFLHEHVFHQLVSYCEKLTSSASDLGSGCYAMVAFSATLGNSEKYPYLSHVDQRFLTDKAFLAAAVQEANREENATCLVLEPSTPKQLFIDVFSDQGISAEKEVEEITDENAFVHYYLAMQGEDVAKERPPIGKDLKVWINVGGWSKDYTTETAARHFLEVAREKNLFYKGVIFFKTSYDKGVEEKHLYLLKKGRKPEDDRIISLRGSNIKKELAEQQLRFDQLFTILSASETTGTDLPFSPTAKALFTVGEGITLSRSAQGWLRLRQFFASNRLGTNQRIVWVVPSHLEEEIRMASKTVREEITSRDVSIWLLQQEGDKEREAIIARAFQEIESVVRNSYRGEKPNQYIEIHRSAFAQKVKADPKELWENGVEKKETKEVLHNYYRAFFPDLREDEGLQVPAQLNEIVTRTENLVDELEVSKHDHFGGRCAQRERQIEKQKQVEKQRSKVFGLQAANEASYPKNVLSLETDVLWTRSLHSFDELLEGGEEEIPVYTLLPQEGADEEEGTSSRRNEPWNDSKERLRNCRSANALYGVSFFPPALYIMGNASHTISTEREVRHLKERGERVIVSQPVHHKSSEYLLVVEEEVTPEETERGFFALSYHDAAEYQRQIQEEKVHSGRRVALFSSNGKIVLNGQGKQGFSTKAIQDIQNQEEIWNAMALLHGKVRDKEYIRKLYDPDPSDTSNAYLTFYNTFTQGLIDDDYADRTLHHAIVQSVNKEKGIAHEMTEEDELLLQEPQHQRSSIHPSSLVIKKAKKAEEVAPSTPSQQNDQTRSSQTQRPARGVSAPQPQKQMGRVQKAWSRMRYLWAHNKAFRVFGILSLGTIPLLSFLWRVVFPARPRPRRVRAQAAG